MSAAKIAPTFPNTIWTSTQFAQLIGATIAGDPVLTRLAMQSEADAVNVRKAVLNIVTGYYPPAGNA